MEHGFKCSMLLCHFFLVVRVLGLLNVVDNEEIFRVVLLKVHFVDFLVVWVLMINYISPMILISEYIVIWIHKDFDLVSHFDF